MLQGQQHTRDICRGCAITALSIGMGLFAVAAPAAVVTVTATGTVQSSCGITLQNAFGSANLNSDGSVNGSAVVNCNAPYRLRASSSNGALKAATTAPAQFSNSLAYNLTAAVPLDAGGQVSATCASSSLTAGSSSCALSPASASGLSSGAGTSTAKVASLSVQWALPTATRLIAGSYSDVITISIAAQQ